MSVLCGTARLLVSPSPVTWIVARGASKKAGTSSKNLGGKSAGRRYGFKKLDGEFVHAGNILATQRLMRWHPGSQAELHQSRVGKGEVAQDYYDDLLFGKYEKRAVE
ncbi:39S ribosomal protein L27, mitochondrial isoform X3 [Hyla sarda]|uniref:39S ribosomal protein L27, mitochondrial isoform X3 n=1 Tax=Hyla sarda TaxID=327740 RepID=UPI0024C4240A|nr:39S ribosomal protein L27, mitochondrial isoform X3 [Hyla sarda]